jgi:hypothetical protein
MATINDDEKDCNRMGYKASIKMASNHQTEPPRGNLCRPGGRHSHVSLVRQMAAAVVCLSLGMMADVTSTWGQDSTSDRSKQDNSQLRWTDLPPAASGGFDLFGKGLEPWKVANQHYFDKHGAIEWKDDVVKLPSGNPGSGIVAKFEVPKNNYELTFEARRTQGEDFFTGLTFPFDDQHATLILGGWGGSTVGISNINGFAAIENSTTKSVPFEQNQWYRVRFQVTPTDIELWIDDQSIFWLDPEEKKFSVWWEQKPMIPLGIASWETGAEIRNLVLKPVKKD